MSDRNTENADLERAVETFLHDVEGVYEEYEEGYVDPDAALWTLEGHLDALRDAHESATDESA